MLHVEVLCSEIEEEKKISENKTEEVYSKELIHKKENVSMMKQEELSSENETVNNEKNENEKEVE